MNEKTDARVQIFSNGTIYLDPVRKVGNMVVKDGKVHALDVDPAVYKDADVVDLGGSAAYPGFMDSHVHLVAMAVVAGSGIRLDGTSKAEDIARVAAEACAKLPAGMPALGMGYMLKDYDAWTLDDLARIDEAINDRAVLLADQTGHSYIANSVAMKKSGLTGDTADPPGGKIVRQNGVPTGMLRENAGYLVGNKAIFPFISDAMIESGLINLFNTWASMGYTSILELMGGPMGRIFKPDLCKKLEREGRLPLRVNYAFTFFDANEIDALADMGKDTEMVRFAGLKLFVDGAAGNGGAWTTFANTLGENGLFAVYDDDTYGEKYNINRIVQKADERGLDVHYHVQGDEAVEVVLGAIEAVLEKKGRLNSVHTLYHLGFVTDGQIERMKKLGDHIVAGVQPAMHWGFMKQTLIDFYGEHGRVSYPYKKFKDAGIILAYSSDYPSNRLPFCGPTANMEVSLTGGGDPVSHPPLSMEDLIRGFTTGSGATVCMQNTGLLDVGYRADMVVFDKDLYSIPVQELSKDNPKVLSTWIGGRKVIV